MRSTLTYGRIHLTHWYDIAQMALLVIVIGLLPSVSSTELMQRTTSGKMFFFLYVILVYAILYSLKFITKLPSSISFSYMDGLLLVWTAYIFINGWFHHIHISDRLLEFGGLMLLYIFLRQIGSSKYGIVLVAMVFGGSVQAIYGNLQLWGYMPSHHALFKMTGSFFNPGPLAGYLASVFPVIIGAILFKKKYVPFIMKKNISNTKILFVLTDISSLKILQQKIGIKINDHHNIFVDRDNRFKLPTENAIYPCIIQVKNGEILQYSFQSPNTAAFHNMKKYLK